MSIEFKNDRFEARLKDFQKFLVNELKFKHEEVNFQYVDKYKLWTIEFRKFIEVEFIKGEHIINICCWEMDRMEQQFHFNLYKGSPSDYNNCKAIMRSLVLF